MPAPKSLLNSLLLHRHFSSVSRRRRSPPALSKIPGRYRPRAVAEAQQALTDYLHSTRALPYTYAEHISKNSSISLANIIAKVDFSLSNFSGSLEKFLRYHPINEFEFFYESIGFDYAKVRDFLPSKKFFLSEDSTALNVAGALSEFGFPWNKLGELYKEEGFGKCPEELRSRLCIFKGYGFGNVSVIGVCLAFPFVLSRELDGEVGGLFDDMKRVFLDYDLGSFVEGNVEAWHEVCKKIRVFYDLGCKKGKVGELMGKSKSIFVDYSLEFLVRKVEYFCRLDVRKEDVGLLILQKPDILHFDLETRVISVEGFLKHFGLSDRKLKTIVEKYPHVMGRNKMANLPHVMRAMDLHLWFFNKLKDEDHQLMASYALSNPDEALNEVFRDGLDRMIGNRASRNAVYIMSKLNFALGIGFGENALTVKVIAHFHGANRDLQERFDCLLRAGIAFSSLCVMIRTMPKIINQNTEIIQHKVNYLCQEMGSSLQYLDVFPAFLNFNLENRIKPRYRFHLWLKEKGLCEGKYSIASMVATSEKKFINRIYGIHPAAPKYWFEYFSCKSSNDESVHAFSEQCSGSDF